MVWANLFKIPKAGPSKFAHEFWGDSTQGACEMGPMGPVGIVWRASRKGQADWE